MRYAINIAITTVRKWGVSLIGVLWKDDAEKWNEGNTTWNSD